MSVVDRLSKFESLAFHGCLTGDCPHGNVNSCVEDIKNHVWDLDVELGQLLKLVRSVVQVHTRDMGQVILYDRVRRLVDWMEDPGQ